MSAPTAASAPTCWWLARPTVWAAEQAALVAAGATWAEDTPQDADSAVDPSAAGAAPRLSLRVDWPHPVPRPGDPAILALRVTYPASYPWFPPTVQLPEALPGLLRHRSPVGTLCLLADPGDWRPDTTLAGLLGTQLPRLLAAGRDPGSDPATLALEAGAEAAWTRTRLSLGALLVDSGCVPPAEMPGGWADLVRVGTALAPVSALVTVLDAEHRILWESRAFGLREVARIRWVRLPDLPPGIVEPGDLWDRAAERLATLGPDDFDSDEPNAVLVLVPSEAAGRRACEEWMLLTRGVPRAGSIEAAAEQTEPELGPADQQAPDAAAGKQLELFDAADQPAESPPAAPAESTHAPAETPVRVRARRAYPIGRDDLTARLPGDTTRLADASVTVVGVGAVGGPVALELVRAGVGRLHLIDGDAHDPATGARQLPTIRDAGSPKALAVALRILDSHPHAHLTCGMRDLGADDGRELPGLAAADLVIDCTANPAANRYLAAHLRAAGTPLVVASATAGGWGGVITTLPAAGGGCWECLQWHRAERTVPWPPARRDGAVIPGGCSHPTYVGGWFDLGAVALQTARTALALLAADPAGAAAAAGSPFGDVQVLTQYRRGRPVHPRWQTRSLAPYPACPLHPQAGEAEQATASPSRRRTR